MWDWLQNAPVHCIMLVLSKAKYFQDNYTKWTMTPPSKAYDGKSSAQLSAEQTDF